MDTVIDILRADFWAAAAVFAVTLACLSYVFYLLLQAISGDKHE